MTRTMVDSWICKGVAMGEDPTHPLGFWKVHGYAKEWYGLLVRGCIAQRLSLKVGMALSKKNPALSINAMLHKNSGLNSYIFRPSKGHLCNINDINSIILCPHTWKEIILTMEWM